MLPTQNQLQEALVFTPETGQLAWKIRPVSHFVTEARWKQFNSRWGETPAFTSCDRHGYPRGNISFQESKYHLRAHRLIWCMMTGIWPRCDIDHKDGNRSNNCWYNLRLASRSENNWNSSGHKTTTGFKGVTKRKNSYVAQMSMLNQNIYLGSFKTPEEAYKAYCDACEKHRGEFGRTS